MAEVLLVLAFCVLWIYAIRTWRRDRRTADMIRAAGEALDMIDADQRERHMRDAVGMPPLHPESLLAPLSLDEEAALEDIEQHWDEVAR